MLCANIYKRMLEKKEKLSMKKINMKLLSAIMALMLLSGCGESAVSGSGQPSESTIESEVSSAVCSEETEKAET